MHKSQLPQTPSNDTLTQQERAAVRRARRGRTFAALGSVGALALMLFNAGCPGAEDMDPPVAGSGPGGGSGGGSGGGGGATGSACETECVKKIFQVNATGCMICHNSGMNNTSKLGMLDLVSPGFTARLRDVPATHSELMAPNNVGCPSGDKLIDSMYPGDSWLYKKVANKQGQCGTVMPSTVPLSATDLACVTAYVECVADGKPITTVKPGGAGGSGGSGSGGASGGSGGASGGSGGASGGSGGASGGSGGASGGGGGSGGTN